MNKIYSPPKNNEVEIAVFGPGFGECVALHVGYGDWLIIDSCRINGSQTPPVITYLEKMGVDLKKQVKSIIATHWHDDHINSINTILSRCLNAEFYIPEILSHKNFGAIIYKTPLTDIVKLGQQKTSTSINELLKVFSILKERQKKPKCVSMDKKIWQSDYSNEITVIALSPHQNIMEKAISSIIALIPKDDSDNNSAAKLYSPSPNYTSVVLSVRCKNSQILLGADMEETNKFKGWSMILDDSVEITSKSSLKSSVYKVAHHGSKTGDCQRIWKEALQEKPFSIVAPCVNGKVKLPTNEDVERIKKNTDKLYLTKNINKAPKEKDKNIKRTYERIKAKNLYSEFSMIRMRKNFEEDSEWQVSKFNNS